MMEKKLFIERLVQLEKIAKKYDVDKQIINKIYTIREEIEKFSLNVLLVGGFSAGKSALINATLDRELLIENQKPETAIATEIVFDDKEHVEIFDETGIKTICSFEEALTYRADEFHHYTYHVNSPFLKKYADFTIVDMPGFNSGIERHNKAIMQYVEKGNAYVLVIDCEDGGINSSSIEFLNEIKQYDNNLAIVVTKGDKKPSKLVLEVVENVKRIASQLYQKEITVVSTSKFASVSEQMEEILHSFNREDIFRQAFSPKLAEIIQLLLASLEKTLQSYQFDDAGLEMEIRERNKAKERLEEQLKRERKKLSHKMKNQVKPAILADVQNALYAQSTILAGSIKAGGNAFTSQVNNILRPVLVTSTQRYTEESFQEFIEQINIDEIFADRTAEIGQEITTKFNAFNSTLQKILETTDKSKGLYRIIASTLAISTTVVAPWLELIILFLPDILKLFGVIGENAQMDKLKGKVETEIIPQIIAKMAPEIENSLTQLEEDLLAEMEGKINDLIGAETEALHQALKMRSTKEEEYFTLKDETAKDINLLKQYQE